MRAVYECGMMASSFVRDGSRWAIAGPWLSLAWALRAHRYSVSRGGPIVRHGRPKFVFYSNDSVMRAWPYVSRGRAPRRYEPQRRTLLGVCRPAGPSLEALRCVSDEGCMGAWTRKPHLSSKIWLCVKVKKL